MVGIIHILVLAVGCQVSMSIHNRYCIMGSRVYTSLADISVIEFRAIECTCCCCGYWSNSISQGQGCHWCIPHYKSSNCHARSRSSTNDIQYRSFEQTIYSGTHASCCIQVTILTTLWKALIHGLNRHYYSLAIDYRKNELEEKMLLNLHKKDWTHGLSLQNFTEHSEENGKDAKVSHAWNAA